MENEEQEYIELTYEEYLEKCKEIKARNEVYLEEFCKDLEKEGLTEKTIQRHRNNVDFYINVYLTREEPLEMIEGASPYKIDDFLGCFFIRKCTWSTPSSIKSNAASIKKFYKSMLGRGHIDRMDYEVLTTTIKEMIEEWMSTCEIYNDPDEENPFAFFF
ncbi:hypothetical protein DSECCO2_292170 [anaerobic digester metagenome]|nr:hypothetical protein NQU17_01070 [Clostridiaceae bacterium HFYG-1003]